MRAYLSLSFALGDSKNAWAGLREALARVVGFSPWRAVPVGFRADAADLDTVRKWVKDNSAAPNPALPQSVNPRALNAMTIAIQTLAMDRPVASIEALPGISKELFPERTPQASNLDKLTPEQRESIKKAAETRRAAEEKSRRILPTNLKDYLDRLVAGYAALKRGEYAAREP